jgi:hypothetical protein
MSLPDDCLATIAFSSPEASGKDGREDKGEYEKEHANTIVTMAGDSILTKGFI